MDFFALWDTDTSNLVGEYPAEADALEAEYRTVQIAGAEALAGYALLRDDGEHDPILIAADAELATLAQRQHVRSQSL